MDWNRSGTVLSRYTDDSQLGFGGQTARFVHADDGGTGRAAGGIGRSWREDANNEHQDGDEQRRPLDRVSAGHHTARVPRPRPLLGFLSIEGTENDAPD